MIQPASKTAQKLVNRSIAIETFSSKSDTPYRKSKLYFTDNGGSEDILFLIISHMSLKYGLLDDVEFMDFMLTPQEIFKILCANIKEYENILNDTHFSSSLFGQYTHSEKLEIWGVHIDSADRDLIDSVIEIDDESLYAAGKIISLMQIVKKDIHKAFFRKGNKFKEPLIDLEDARAAAIDKNIKKNFPTYKSNLFFSLLLVSNLFSVRFFAKHLPENKNVEYKGLFKENATTVMDDNLYSLVNDIDLLLQNKKTYCCEKHGHLTYRKLIKNKDNNCLNERVNSLLGVGLKEIVQ